jgi:hypothetical protein
MKDEFVPGMLAEHERRTEAYNTPVLCTKHAKTPEKAGVFKQISEPAPTTSNNSTQQYQNHAANSQKLPRESHEGQQERQNQETLELQRNLEHRHHQNQSEHDKQQRQEQAASNISTQTTHHLT